MRASTRCRRPPFLRIFVSRTLVGVWSDFCQSDFSRCLVGLWSVGVWWEVGYAPMCRKRVILPVSEVSRLLMNASRTFVLPVIGTTS